MARFKKKKDISLGNVSIGEKDIPVKKDDNDKSVRKRKEEIRIDTDNKVENYRKNNPEKPKSEKSKTKLDAPLKIKRTIGSLDGEYVEIAKRYLGIPLEKKPTIVEFSKGIIKLFEDNSKLYKEISRLKDTLNGIPRTSAKHSWEQNSSWN